MNRFSGKTALITGSSRGIGRAVAERLAAEGAAVILHCNQNRAAADELAAQIRSPRVLQADLSSPSEIERIFAELGAELGSTRLDILVNNAGIWKPTPLGKTSPEAVDEMLNTNLKSVFLVTQAALPLLRDGARIVNMSSVAGRLGVGERNLYGATKAAMDSLTRSWALELAPRGILVNAVAPGYIETDMTAEHFSDSAVLENAIQRSPLGRLGNAAEIADVVAFFCSDEARWITGQSLNVSGGFTI
jgi:NAD(P)-dependent dehydrogenase (short-subunit alcohol dehydrogenase family)